MPASMKNFRHHQTIPLDIALPQAVDIGNETGILDHVSHQIGRFPAYGVEIQPSFSYEFLENIMRGDSDSMTNLL
jgi:hypothetical protein